MTAAAALLDRLGQLGVAASSDGTGLRLRPASRVPADLLADLRAHKTEVLSLLTAANDPVPTLPDAADDPPPSIASVVGALPDDAWVDAMAEALAANPVHRITNRDAAMQYFRGRALAMLDATPNPYARGLLLIRTGRRRHVMVVHSEGTGR